MRENYWTNFAARRASRRRVLAGGAAAVAGLAGLAALACGDDDDAPAASASPTSAAGATTTGGTAGAATAAPTIPKDLSKLTLEEMRTLFSGSRLKDLPGHAGPAKSGGTLRFASRTPVTWDPTSAAGSLMSSYLFANNQLVQFRISDFVKNPNFMEVEAVLAESMPEQPDPQTFVFKLRKGVKFQNVPPVNGREFVAEDVVYSTEAYRKAPAQGPTFQDVDKVEAPDKYTVVFKMARPAAYFLGAMVIPFHWIFSREQHQGPDGLTKLPIGTGGFLYESSENLQGYKFKRNPDYFRKDDRGGAQLPYLDRLETTFYPSPAQSIAAYRAGELDHLWPQNVNDWRNVMETTPDSVTQVTTPPPSFQPFIAMRVDKPPLNDVRVRRALSLLIDRPAIIKSLAGGMAGYGYGQDWTYFGNEWPWEPSQLGQWMKPDPKEAKALLDAAAVKDLQLDFLMTQFAGFNFEVWNAIAGMWQAVGIKTVIDAPQDSAKWQQQYFGGTYNHLTGTGNIGPGWDPDTFAYHALHSKSPKNYFKVNDPKIDELALKQRQTMNTNERKTILQELMKYDLDQVTRLWTVTPYKINLRRPTLYNLVDTEAAWNPVGWGSCGLDKAWKA